MTAKRTGMILVLILCLVGLSGCVFDSVDAMYALPKSSEAYVNLQAKIHEQKGSAEYIAPLGGENRQTIQLVDIDGDQVQEAVAFFREIGSETPLKIVLFRQTEDGQYETYAEIQGVGSEIESIDYLDLTGSGGADILVSWRGSAQVHTLSAYSLDSGKPVEIMHSNYGRYLAADLDGDPSLELVLAQQENSSPSRWRLEYYNSRDGVLEDYSTVSLSEGATDISSWSAGTLKNGTPALFVTSYFGKDVLVNDIFCAGPGGLKNIALKNGAVRSSSVFHYYAGVHPIDINKDGVTETPTAVPIRSYGTPDPDGFWWLNWMQYQPNGSREIVQTTYHSLDGWYLDLPRSWKGDFAMSREEDSAAGARSVSFARLNPNGPCQPFLTISSLTGPDRAEQSQQKGRFRLYADTTTIYTGQLHADGWNCGLDAKGIAARFHPPGSDDWVYPNQ